MKRRRLFVTLCSALGLALMSALAYAGAGESARKVLRDPDYQRELPVPEGGPGGGSGQLVPIEGGGSLRCKGGGSGSGRTGGSGRAGGSGRGGDGSVEMRGGGDSGSLRGEGEGEGDGSGRAQSDGWDDPGRASGAPGSGDGDGSRNGSGSVSVDGDGATGSGEGREGSGDGTRGSGDGTRGSGDGTRGSGDGTRGSGDGTPGSGDGTRGSGDGWDGRGSEPGGARPPAVDSPPNVAPPAAPPVAPPIPPIAPVVAPAATGAASLFATLLYVLLGALVLALLFYGIAALLRWYRARRPDAPGEADAPSERELEPVRLSDAERLAQDGRYAEAIHALLLAAVGELGDRGGVRLRDAMTSREVLLGARLEAEARQALAELVLAVEVSLFGGAAVGKDEWLRCLATFENLSQRLAALRASAAQAAA